MAEPIERTYWNTIPVVYIIVLTWNQRQDTVACLASLERLTYPRFRIVVVDNGSEDGTFDAVRQQFPAVELLINEHNLGFQGGFNAGMRYAQEHGADFLLVMNNDTAVQPDILDELMAYAGAPDVGILSPKIYYFDEPERIWSVGGDCHPITFEMIHKGDNQIDRGQWSDVIERNFLVGCAMLKPRALPAVLAEIDVTLLIVGEVWGHASVYRSRLAELNLQTKAQLINRYVSNDEAAMYFAAADLAILPYREATGSAVLQSVFGLGVLVVTTRTGGMNEVVEDDVTDFLVESGDVAELSVDPNLGTMNLIMGTAAPNRLGNGIDSHDSGTPH